MEPVQKLTLEQARRLAISSQFLDQPLQSSSKESLLATIRQLGCLQIDPIRVVAPSQYLVLWSRLGTYERSWLDELLWQDRSLFEYWAHAASIVLADNYPIHHHQMRTFATGDSAWSRRAQGWLEENKAARKAILDELEDGRRLAVDDFKTEVEALWQSTGWTNAQGVKHLLQLMWRKGEVAAAGRQGNRKLWAAADYWYQGFQRTEKLPLGSAMEQAVMIAANALGVATAAHLRDHFIKGFYPDIDSTIERLVKAGELRPVKVEGGRADEIWVLPQAKVSTLDAIERGDWHGRTTLLSPFDNLTTDRERVERLWDFNARSELYVSKADRKYGHYVLPILWQDRLAGRVDPTFNRKDGVLEVEAVFAEEWARGEAAVAVGLAAALTDLAEFLGADQVALSRRLPRAWQKPLRAGLG